MEGTRNQDHERVPGAGRHFREETETPAGPAADVIVTTLGPLQVTAEEDTGGDPYNHTGTFKRTIR